MTNTPWEEIEHTADVALRVYGETLAALFTHAARGMLSLAGGQPANGDTRQIEIKLEAIDTETLLVDWLTEIAYLLEGEELVVTDVKIGEISERALGGAVIGQPGRAFDKHIKAVTYHALSITQAEDGYRATIVFDV